MRLMKKNYSASATIHYLGQENQKERCVDEGGSTGWDPVLIYYRNAYKQISHDWGTAHTNDAAEK